MLVHRGHSWDQENNVKDITIVPNNAPHSHIFVQIATQICSDSTTTMAIDTRLETFRKKHSYRPVPVPTSEELICELPLLRVLEVIVGGQERVIFRSRRSQPLPSPVGNSSNHEKPVWEISYGQYAAAGK